MSSPGTLEAFCDLSGLLDVLVGGAPEKEASGHSPDRHRYSHFRSHTKDAVFHGGEA
jgi:hypothetical protein